MNEKPLALVVEDDQDLSIIFGEALKAAGFETELIRDGQKALDRLSMVKPRVVVLDLHLPHVSGMKILSTIRSSERTNDVYVIIVTADARMAEMQDGIADFIMIKPISFSQLRDISSRLKTTFGGTMSSSEETLN